MSSVTWFYLAAVDQTFRDGVRAGQPWTRPTVLRESKNRERIAQNWAVMREHMGNDRFDALQEAVVRAGFTGFRGEPDLFCYAPSGGRWFFAEAKGKDNLLASQVSANPTSPGWFDIARTVLGESGLVRVYRLVPSRS